VVDILTGPLSEVTLSTPLAPSSGGTGLSSPGASGNVLVSNGSAWTSGTGIPTGVIFLWSGSIASIPSGFALCDGTSGTPDLRNRFIVGAGSTYAVNATGGSADAIVVSHNHTATSSVSDPGHYHTATTVRGGGVGLIQVLVLLMVVQFKLALDLQTQQQQVFQLLLQ
jgi:hypothetical protein